MEAGFDRYPGVTMLFQQGYPTDLEAMWEAGEMRNFAIIQKDVETEVYESPPFLSGRDWF